MTDTFTLNLTQLGDYRFEVAFDNPAVPHLVTDEAAPLGGDAGPNPARLLAAAVANCLSASLVFAMRKFKNDTGTVRTSATATLGRNAADRLRVQGIAVEIRLGVPAASLHMAERLLAQFEDFCVVTQSVRAAIPVAVRVLDAHGQTLHERKE